MAKHGKQYRAALKEVEKDKEYSIQEAVEIIKKMNYVKFDASVEGHFNIKYKSLQNVRGVIQLPHGTGKQTKVLVFAKGDKAEAAKKAGADYVGDAELLKKVQEGWTDFDAVVSTPDMMKDVGKLGPVLGRKGLMPKPKAGTVTTEVEQIIKQLKSGRIEYKADKTGVVHFGLGKLSFEDDKICENITSAFNVIMRDKPSDAKGDFVVGMFVGSTMTPSLRISTKELRK
ncbi:MAG: 50S ribosomal protein L1 [Spirochaetia bacterium]|nr:50S ribosomal protein L1 [Spirochaetia bacterium]